MNPTDQATRDAIIARLRQRARLVRAMCDKAIKLGKPRDSLDIVTMRTNATLDEQAADLLSQMEKSP